MLVHQRAYDIQQTRLSAMYGREFEMSREKDEEGTDAYETQRWRWVLESLHNHIPWWVPPNRKEEPDSDSEILEHLAWLTLEGARSTELRLNPRKAMRWACWAQGAMVALRLVSLAECKRLNMRATYEEACRKADAQ